jgi:hypothetical protein
MARLRCNECSYFCADPKVAGLQSVIFDGQSSDRHLQEKDNSLLVCLAVKVCPPRYRYARGYGQYPRGVTTEMRVS